VFALARTSPYISGPEALEGARRGPRGDAPGAAKTPYDLTGLAAVNETLDLIRKKYVDPARREAAADVPLWLDQVQQEVAQVIVLHDERSPTLKVASTQRSASFARRQRPGALGRLGEAPRGVAFLQVHLKDSEVRSPEVEYAACNGMLRTLDPHSVFLSPDAFEEMNLSTSGHFGGLGIVISIRDQMLTSHASMPGTPAGRSGLKRLDRIMKNQQRVHAQHAAG